MLEDSKHSQREVRFHALGRTDDTRPLHITFTLRQNGTLIRVISARDMHRTERRAYEQVKKTPSFKTEAEERSFWETHNSSDFMDWSQAQPVALPKLKPSTRTISLRLPEAPLDRIKIEANKRDMPYQSLIKAWLAEDVNEARR